MLRIMRRLLTRWHHRSLGELYLLSSGIGSLLFGLALLLLPHRLTTGTSMVTLYSLADREVWGVAFLVLAVLALGAAYRPTEERFLVVMSVQAAAQTGWAVGLTAPSFTTDGVANVLAPLAWLQLASTAGIVLVSARRPVLPPRRRRSTDQVD